MAWLNTHADPILVSDEEYYQSIALEKIPTLFVDGEPTSWRLVAHTLRCRDRVEEYRALTKAAALAIGGETVKQAGNENYSFDYYSVKISRRRANESNGWIVTKTTSWRALYSDGAYGYGAPLSAFD